MILAGIIAFMGLLENSSVVLVASMLVSPIMGELQKSQITSSMKAMILAGIIAFMGLLENSSVVLVASMLVSPIMGEHQKSLIILADN